MVKLERTIWLTLGMMTSHKFRYDESGISLMASISLTSILI